MGSRPIADVAKPVTSEIREAIRTRALAQGFDAVGFATARLADLLDPHWLRIGGYWYPRGGIPIDVFWQTGKAPEGLWIPDQGVASYRGRG